LSRFLLAARLGGEIEVGAGMASEYSGQKIIRVTGNKPLMGVILEIKAGPMAGKVIGLKIGESATIGRAAGRAQHAFPNDTFMSGVHFAVECGPQGCRVIDQKSSNGTFLNGARIKDAMLANGDEIKGGQTAFAVKIVPDAKIASLAPLLEVASPATRQEQPSAEPAPPASPRATPPVLRPAEGLRAAPVNAAPQAPSARSAQPETPKPEVRRPPVAESAPQASQRADRGIEPTHAVPPVVKRVHGEQPAARGVDSPRGFAFSVMGWSFPAAPAEWQIQEGFGLQQAGQAEFPSSLAATEEILGGISLQQYVESQISVLRGYLRDPKIEPTMPPQVNGAEESMAMDVRHLTKDGRELVYRRIYARSGASVGVLTVTTLAGEFPRVLQSLQPLLDGAAFRSTAHQ
jgi:pSer/pThr/pTyr-binding forkhead associated (FHA) protein